MAPDVYFWWSWQVHSVRLSRVLFIHIWQSTVTALVQFYYAYHLNSLGRSRIFTLVIFLVHHIA